MEDLETAMSFKQQGFYCSQILVLQGLERMGKSNPDLIRAVHALAGGIGFSGELCGALTGGACVLGLYAGKGTPDEAENPRLSFMTMELVKWFKAGYGETYAGIRCEEILSGNTQNKAIRCPGIVASVNQKVKELLVENGYDLSGLDA